MSDIALSFNNSTQSGDLVFFGGDLAIENPLETAVLVSLFSDRLAPDQLSADDKSVGLQIPGNALNSANSPRRGWWGDSFGEGKIGSRLWQLRRMIRADNSSALREVEAVIYEALDWLEQDGIASQVTVSASWAGEGGRGVDFTVTISQPAGETPRAFQFSLAWDALRNTA